MSISETGIQASASLPARIMNETLDAKGGRGRRQYPPLVRGLLTVIEAVASLRLTVMLFALSIMLIFFGTLAQKDGGIWTIVSNYFRTSIVWVPLQIFFPGSFRVGGGFLFPGGWTLGALLMTNLLAAHITLMLAGYKKWTSGSLGFPWRLPGILLIHSGLVVMMISEFITGMYATEGQMAIAEGQSSSQVQENRFAELVIADPTDPSKINEVVVPQSMLRGKSLIKHKDLPFDIQPVEFFVNSDIREAGPGDKRPPGLVGSVVAVEHAEIAGTSQEQTADIPSAYVNVKDKRTGKSLGTHLFSVWITRPQTLSIGGKSYDVSLRFKRTYRPFSIHLVDFSFDRYPGTQIARNFSSKVLVDDPERNFTSEPITIRMNEPLRYRGETFYQASFDKSEKGTVLQVVDNPGWLMPYISCIMVAVGMLVHFSIVLVRFGLKNEVAQPRVQVRSTPIERWFPWAVTGAAVLYLTLMMFPRGDREDAMHLHKFGQLPVHNGGRVMPFGDVARSSLATLSGGYTTYTIRDKEDKPVRTLSATEWLLDVLILSLGEPRAIDYKVIRVENEQVLAQLLGLKGRSGFRYSFKEIEPKIRELLIETEKVKQKDEKARDLRDHKVVETTQRMDLLFKLAQQSDPLAIPPLTSAGEWQPYIQAREDESNSLARRFGAILEAYKEGNVAKFNRELDEYQSQIAQRIPADAARVAFEDHFDAADPFFQCMLLYGVAFLLAIGSWIGWTRPLSQAAFYLATMTFIVQTGALFGRMYLLDRPFVFVTNLYSSAIFIAWGGVLIALTLDNFLARMMRSSTFAGLGVAVASVLGFLSLFVARQLALTSEDTIGVMQAVLDTNLWLATHVTTVTLGYAATFVAGFLGVLYIFLGVFTRVRDHQLFPVLGRMIYGVVCFATLLSFTGTVLGGIWADQSWGRFWGWDPKENGALIIVLWNALILHARWAGIFKHRGVAVAAVFGNIVTAWSWFGVNILGVGLHSYGFSTETLVALIVFATFNMAVIITGLLPKEIWRSYSNITQVLPAE